MYSPSNTRAHSFDCSSLFHLKHLIEGLKWIQNLVLLANWLWDESFSKKTSTAFGSSFLTITVFCLKPFKYFGSCLELLRRQKSSEDFVLSIERSTFARSTLSQRYCFHLYHLILMSATTLKYDFLVLVQIKLHVPFGIITFSICLQTTPLLLTRYMDTLVALLWKGLKYILHL